MTSQVDPSQGPQPARFSPGGLEERETCRKLISLGYACSNRVRLYGQELQLVSDPFPHREGGIAVEVMESSTSVSRVIKLPLSVLQVANKKPQQRSA
jgi:hypothetical protein